MKINNKDKTYTYIVLIIGLLIWLFYFYHGRDSFLTTRQYRTEYSYFFHNFHWTIGEFFENMWFYLLL